MTINSFLDEITKIYSTKKVAKTYQVKQ